MAAELQACDLISKIATSRAGRTSNSRPWTSQVANNGFGSFGRVFPSGDDYLLACALPEDFGLFMYT
jgi:hypothetical protein